MIVVPLEVQKIVVIGVLAPVIPLKKNKIMKDLTDGQLNRDLQSIDKFYDKNPELNKLPMPPIPPIVSEVKEETINYLLQVGDTHCLRCHKEFKDSIHTLNCPFEVKHCGRLEGKECEFSKPHPNHICRFNDGKQNCDCYADGYADGLKIGQEVKEVEVEEGKECCEKCYEINSEEYEEVCGNTECPCHKEVSKECSECWRMPAAGCDVCPYCKRPVPISHPENWEEEIRQLLKRNKVHAFPREAFYEIQNLISQAITTERKRVVEIAEGMLKEENWRNIKTNNSGSAISKANSNSVYNEPLKDFLTQIKK